MKYEVVDAYLSKVEKAVYNLYPAQKLIESMSEYLKDYCDEHPDCTMEDLEKTFGRPEEVAKEFLEDKGVTHPDKIKKIKRSRIIIIAVMISILAAVIVYFVDTLNHMNGYVTDILIVEPDDDEEDIDKMVDDAEFIEDDYKDSVKENIKKRIEEETEKMYEESENEGKQ